VKHPESPEAAPAAGPAPAEPAAPREPDGAPPAPQPAPLAVEVPQLTVVIATELTAPPPLPTVEVPLALP
jgi:hypothetical protein